MGGFSMDHIYYTGQITKEELSKRLNKLLNKYLDEMYQSDKIGEGE